MCNRLRRLLLCLLIASLPMQGIAAVARFECALAHQSSTVGKEPNLKMLARLTAVFDTAEVVKHHTPGRTPDANPKQSDCENTDGPEPFRCGTCTTCCIAAYAPPPGTGLTTAHEGANGVPEPSLSSFSGHVPARIERPPRPA
jgi:hypothetical protein